MAPLSGCAARMISSTNSLRPIRAKSASPPITPLPRGRSSSRNPQILRPQSCCSVIDAATRLPAAPAPIMSTFRVSPRAGPPYSLNFHLQPHKAATWSTPAITIKPLIVHGAPSRKYAAHNRNVAQKTDFPRMRLCLLKSEPPTQPVHVPDERNQCRVQNSYAQKREGCSGGVSERPDSWEEFSQRNQRR